jgi:hypothetical protein
MTPAKIFDPRRFKWIPASHTNIIKTWEKFGFERPSKSPWYLEKWSLYK